MPRSVFLLVIIIASWSCKNEPNTGVSGPDPVTKIIDQDKRLDVITFGSCSKHDEKQPLWKFIGEEEPDLWIWGGDNIYGDSKDMVVLEDRYEQQLSHPAYKKFIEQVPIIGTWDDHDYGVNDGGKNYEMKRESRDLMFKFLGVPEDDPSWSREGAYQSYSFGTGAEQVKIILLDTRYFRDNTKKTATRKSYVPTTGDILGESQWKWLEQELMGSEAKLNIIVSGIQVIPEDHNYEKWANFPLSRDRLFNLVRSSKSNTFLISGDRHIGEISSIELGDQMLHEITSSGLTHSYDSFPGEKNQHRVSEVVSSLNYGKVSIDWDANPVVVFGEIKGEGGKGYEKIEFTLN